MKLNLLTGTLIGFTIVFVIRGYLENDFEWTAWFFWMLGGAIGHLVFGFLVKSKDKNEDV